MASTFFVVLSGISWGYFNKQRFGYANVRSSYRYSFLINARRVHTKLRATLCIVLIASEVQYLIIVLNKTMLSFYSKVAVPEAGVLEEKLLMTQIFLHYAVQNSCNSHGNYTVVLSRTLS